MVERNRVGKVETQFLSEAFRAYGSVRGEEGNF